MAERPSVEKFEKLLSDFQKDSEDAGYWLRAGSCVDEVYYRNESKEEKALLLAMFRAALEAK